MSWAGDGERQRGESVVWLEVIGETRAVTRWPRANQHPCRSGTTGSPLPFLGRMGTVPHLLLQKSTRLHLPCQTTTSPRGYLCRPQPRAGSRGTFCASHRLFRIFDVFQTDANRPPLFTLSLQVHLLDVVLTINPLYRNYGLATLH